MIELKIVETINHFGLGTWVDRLTILVSNNILIVLFIITLLLVVLIFDRKNFRAILFSLIIAGLIFFIFNELIFRDLLQFFSISRIRPFLVSDSIIQLGVRVADSSFPSGHMGMITLISTIFIYYYRYYRKIWPIGAILILIMAFARLHNGMHYLTDVAAGAILGFFCGIIGILIAGKINRSSSIRQ